MQFHLKTMLIQISGMIRYEFIRNWRRKGLPMMMGVWLVSVILGTNLFTGPSFFQPSPELLAGSPLIHKVGVTLDILIASGGISTVFAIFTLSILAGEVVPVDRQLGVTNWFNALPVSAATFLFGKLFGIWTAVFAGIITIAAISGMAHFLWLGAFELSAFMQLWLIALTAISFYVSGISVFITSWIKSRRWAIFVSLGLSIVGYFYLMSGFSQFIANVYTAFYRNNLAGINAETCRIHPDLCGQSLMTPELFPTFIDNMGVWVGQLTAVFIGIAFLAWVVRKWEENR